VVAVFDGPQEAPPEIRVQRRQLRAGRLGGIDGDLHEENCLVRFPEDEEDVPQSAVGGGQGVAGPVIPGGGSYGLDEERLRGRGVPEPGHVHGQVVPGHQR
jgi:hypothetical protein